MGLGEQELRSEIPGETNPNDAWTSCKVESNTSQCKLIIQNISVIIQPLLFQEHKNSTIQGLHLVLNFFAILTMPLADYTLFKHGMLRSMFMPYYNRSYMIIPKPFAGIRL